jgi:excisionase family DNA binding protein
MAQTYQITSISGEELQDIIRATVLEAMISWQRNNPSEPASPEYVTRRQISQLLQVSLPTVDDYIRRGILPACRIRGRILIKLTDVERSLEDVKSLRYKRK